MQMLSHLRTTASNAEPTTIHKYDTDQLRPVDNIWMICLYAQRTTMMSPRLANWQSSIKLRVIQWMDSPRIWRNRRQHFNSMSPLSNRSWYHLTCYKWMLRDSINNSHHGLHALLAFSTSSRFHCASPTVLRRRLWRRQTCWKLYKDPNDGVHTISHYMFVIMSERELHASINRNIFDLVLVLLFLSERELSAGKSRSNLNMYWRQKGEYRNSHNALHAHVCEQHSADLPEAEPVDTLPELLDHQLFGLRHLLEGLEFLNWLSIHMEGKKLK